MVTRHRLPDLIGRREFVMLVIAAGQIRSAQRCKFTWNDLLSILVNVFYRAFRLLSSVPFVFVLGKPCHAP